jgi:16S rRNA (uracil1498-N3)-methyltransferase
VHRFYVPAASITGGEAAIQGDAARQIARVLRMQPGDTVCLFDGSGDEYIVRLTAFGRDEARGEVVERRAGQAEPVARLTLYLALLNKPEKFEWALQKCTEVGASAFVPVLTSRTVAGQPNPSRYERWSRIVQEAAEQSGRTVLPALEPALPFDLAVSKAAFQGTAVIPSLGVAVPLAAALEPDTRQPSPYLNIFIGPEGGFTTEEVSAAASAGVVPVTLGPRTLRAETAAVVALSLALHSLGEMG